MGRNVLSRSTQARTGDRMPQNGDTDVAVTGYFELYDSQCCTRLPCLATSSTYLAFCECETTSVVMRCMSHSQIPITQRCTKHKHSKSSFDASKSSWLPVDIDLQYDFLCGRMLPSLWVGVIPGTLCDQGEASYLASVPSRCVWLYGRVFSRYKLVGSDCLLMCTSHERQ